MTIQGLYIFYLFSLLNKSQICGRRIGFEVSSLSSELLSDWEAIVKLRDHAEIVVEALHG